MSTEKLTVVGHLKALAQRLQNTRNTVSQLAQATTDAIEELDHRVDAFAQTWAATPMIHIGGVMAAVAHQGGHAVYAERVQVDAFQDPDQITEYEGVYYCGGSGVQLLTTGLSSGTVYSSPTASHPNSFHAENSSQKIEIGERSKLFTFYPDYYGTLTNLTMIFNMSLSTHIKMQLIIQDTESNQDVMTTELQTVSSDTSTVSFPVRFRLDPNRRYAMYVYVENRRPNMARLEFTITPLVYSTGSVTMKPMEIPAGTARLEMLLHDNGTAVAAALKFDSGEFTALTQSSAKADKIPGGTDATLRRYSIDVPDGAQTAQLKLTLNDNGSELYDYALIAI